VAVGDHAAHTHTVTSNVAVGDHASHTHTVTAAGTNSAPTFTGSAMSTHAHELPLQLVSGTSMRHLPAATFGTGTSRAAQGGETATANTTSAAVALSQAVSAGTPAGTVSAPTFTGSQVTSGGPSATLTHSVTNNQVTSGNPSATLTHSVTNNQVTSGNPSATLSHSVTQPSDHTISAHDSPNSEPPYVLLNYIIKT
jgi:hypothetical protein